MPSDVTKFAVTAAIERAKSSVAVFISDGGQNEFSAILLKLGRFHLAVTAAHCVRDIKDRRSLIMSTFASGPPGVLVLDPNFHALTEVDIGVITLEPSCAEHLAVHWLGLEDLDSNLATPGQNVVLIGFPASLFSVAEAGPQSVASPQPVGLALEVSFKRPVSSLRRADDPRVDFYLNWDVGKILDRSTDRPLAALDPSGMSGSGVFWIPPDTGQHLWSPTAIRLSGILSSTIEREGLIRCMRVEHALTLLGVPLEISDERPDQA